MKCVNIQQIARVYEIVPENYWEKFSLLAFSVLSYL